MIGAITESDQVMADSLEVQHAHAAVELKRVELEQAEQAYIEAYKTQLVRVSREELFDMLKNNNKLKPPEGYCGEPGKITVLAPCDYETLSFSYGGSHPNYTGYVCLTKDGEDLIADGYRWSSSDRYRNRDYCYIWADHRRWR